MADLFGGGTNTESFIQQQKRLNPTPTQPTAPQTYQSPVSATGAPQATTQPNMGTDPFAASGGGVWTGSGWIPKSHPSAAQYSKPAGGAATTAPATAGQYPARPAGTGLEGIQLPNTPAPTYTPAQTTAQYGGQQFSQWQNQGQQGMNASQNALLDAILKNPYSLSQDVVGQMKGQQQDQALLMAQQARNAAQQNAAGRGLQGTGGFAEQSNRQIDNDTISSLLGGYRDIDIAKAKQDRSDVLNALGMSEDILQGQLGRASSEFENSLQGQGLQADDNFRKAGFDFERDRFGADESFRGYQSQADAQKSDLDRLLAQFGINTQVSQNAQQNYETDLDAFFRNKDLGLQTRNLDLQKELGLGGLAVDRARLTESGRQFDLGHALDALGFLENRRQSDNDLGYRYNALDQQGQSSIFDFLSRALGR